MTRQSVQLALFAAAAWLLTWVSAIVLAVVVRSPVDTPWVAEAWIVAMSISGIGIVLALLWLVVADTVRVRPAVTPEEVLEPGLEETAELASELEPDVSAGGTQVLVGDPSIGIGSVVPVGPDGPKGPEGPEGPRGPEGPPPPEFAGEPQPVRRSRGAGSDAPARDFPSSSVPGESPLLRGRQS